MECEVGAILAETNRTAHEQNGICSKVTGHDCALTKELSGPVETLYFILLAPNLIAE